MHFFMVQNWIFFFQKAWSRKFWKITILKLENVDFKPIPLTGLCNFFRDFPGCYVVCIVLKAYLTKALFIHMLKTWAESKTSKNGFFYTLKIRSLGKSFDRFKVLTWSARFLPSIYRGRVEKMTKDLVKNAIKRDFIGKIVIWGKLVTTQK